MRILLVCDSSLEKDSLEHLLREHGHMLVANILPSDNFPVIAKASRPGAIVVYIRHQTKKLFGQLRQLNDLYPCPVVVFAKKSNDIFARDSVKAGISSYIVNGFAPERFKTIIDIAVARFEETKGLKDELSRTREALSDRKLIEQAKKILISQKGISEDEAYRTLRRMALHQNVKMSQMAKNIVRFTEALAAPMPS